MTEYLFRCQGCGCGKRVSLPEPRDTLYLHCPCCQMHGVSSGPGVPAGSQAFRRVAPRPAAPVPDEPDAAPQDAPGAPETVWTPQEFARLRFARWLAETGRLREVYGCATA